MSLLDGVGETKGPVEPWRAHWKGMPEFVQEDLGPFRTVPVHFACQEDVDAFAKLVEQNIGPRTQSIWWPKAAIGRFKGKAYVQQDSLLAQAGEE